MKNFNKGIICSSLGSFWWGVLGTYYFQYISFIGTFEVVVHRSIWTFIILLLSTTFFNKWNLFKKIFFDKKKAIYAAFVEIPWVDTSTRCRSSPIRSEHHHSLRVLRRASRPSWRSRCR